MTSAWFGLNTGVSALEAAQTMLDTSAHNVANANTPGYSRQRVSLVASAPFSYPSFNRSGLPGQIGSGVTVSSVMRVRDSFLDMQIDSQTALQGQWDTRRDELAKVESVFPEPNGSGLGSVLTQFWNGWQDVATDPTSSAARSSLVEQAASLAARFNRDAGQLTSLRSSEDYQVGQSVSQINDLATRIAALNDQIQRVSVSGDHPNDLMDQRDQLLEQLNAIVPVTQNVQSDGSVDVLVGGTDLVAHGSTRAMVATKDPATGFLTPSWSSGGAVDLGAGSLSALVETRDVTVPGYLTQLNQLAAGVATAVNAIHQNGIDQSGNKGGAFFTMTAGNEAATLAVSAPIAADPSKVAAATAPNQPGDGGIAGQIADLQNAISYSSGTAASNLVSGVSVAGGSVSVASLDVGQARAQAYTLSDSSVAGPPAQTLLTLTGADGSKQSISVADMGSGSSQVLAFSQLGVKITLQASSDTTGSAIVAGLTSAPASSISVGSIFTPPKTASDMYSGLVGKIGADSSQASEMAGNQELVVNQLTQRRDSTSGVSLDEEATDMIRFQHAYQAAARVITTIDQMLDTLINHTGLVGL